MIKKKKIIKKKRRAVKKKITILSYSIKMVIPTVAYGNIQPEIIVKANSLDEAHDFIVPHMNKLWKEYYLVDGKRPTTTPIDTPAINPVSISPTPTLNPTPTPAPVHISPPVSTPNPTNITSILLTPPVVEKQPVAPTEPPASSVALVKATQAIESCMSKEALEIIIDRVQLSTKLTSEDKESLLPLLEAKHNEFNKE